MISSTSVTDSLSDSEVDLDTGLSTKGLTSLDSVLDSNLGTWVSSDELVNYLGTDVLDLAIPATNLVVQAGEDAKAWVSIPKGGTDSQADLESSSWILLDDLVPDLTASTTLPIQSVLLTQPHGSSDAVVYVSLEDQDSTLNTLPLDHPLDSFLYSDLVGVTSATSDLGLGDDSDAATPPAESPSLAPHLDASVGSETDLLAPKDVLDTDANTVVDGTPDPLTPASSSLGLGTNLVNDLLNTVDVDVTSYPEQSGPGGVSVCMSSGNGK